MNKWDQRFLTMARLVASWSKDPSTKCGAVITEGKCVVSMGFNGYPKNVEDNAEDARELKYAKVIHAELNAILHANRDLTNCTIYVVPLQPCSSCASVIIQSGITRVVSGIPKGTDESRWLRSYEIADMMYKESGVTLTRIEI